MMEKNGGLFYGTGSGSTTGATPKGQSQTAPAKPAPARDEVKTELHNSITITAPSPVFKKR